MEILSGPPTFTPASIHWLAGSRPSGALKLLWKDIDFDRGNYNKRDTKSGKMLIQPMNEKVREVLLQQRELLNSGSAELRESAYAFPASGGGLRRLDSLKKRFSQLRDLAGIPKEFRPNYCLRDTIALMMLSNGSTLAEVAYQLGHAPGSPMTRRYAKSIPVAQQSIANKAQEAMITLLDSKGLEANMCQEKTPDRFDIDYSFEEELESL